MSGDTRDVYSDSSVNPYLKCIHLMQNYLQSHFLSTNLRLIFVTYFEHYKLFSLFNGKQISWVIQFQDHPCRWTVVFIHIADKKRGVHIFLKGRSTKPCVIAWVEFKLAYNNFAVQQVYHTSCGFHKTLYSENSFNKYDFSNKLIASLQNSLIIMVTLCR